MNRVVAFLACLAFLTSACQSAASATPPARPSDPLRAADARLFAGDYDGAEAAYQRLIAAENPAAQVHYTFLLEYENRFREAVTVARAAAAAQPDASSLAGLTRALDWSEDVTGAVAAGSRAVSVGAGDPLAHAFYSEALADSARFGVARKELMAAEKAAHDPYAVAEVEREWSNYYRALGDVHEELNHLQLSIQAQPGFPERRLELARYEYDQQKPAAARAILATLRKAHSADYGVNVAIGDTAALHRDVTVADEAYRAALKVRPNGTAASLGEAELEVSMKRDFNAAHDLLLASLKANPASLDVYNYLYHLDLLVLKSDPVQELGTAPAGTGLSDARREALDRVNRFRSTVGLPALTESAPLAQAALAHAYFWLFNFGQPAVADVRIHDEDPSLPGATGADSLARARHFGFAGQRTGEDISHAYLPTAAVDHWVDAVFHRVPLSDPEAATAGYGELQVGVLSIQVLDLGLTAASTHGLVVYPAPNLVNVPNAFLGNEIPDPAPTARYPTGYPVTVQVGSGSALRVEAAALVGPDGSVVAGYSLDPAQLKSNEYGFLPRDPLVLGGRYTVQLKGTLDGAAFQKVWLFTVSAS